MNTPRMKRYTTIVVALMFSGGCGEAQQQEWDWFGLASKDRQTKPTDQSQAAGQARTASKRTAESDDPQARDVDQRVDQYVRSMPARYDSTYEGNDFQSKMRRQSDPDRQERIRQAAMLTRDASDSPRREPEEASERSEPLEPDSLGGAKAAVDSGPPSKSPIQDGGPLSLRSPTKARRPAVETPATVKTAKSGPQPSNEAVESKEDRSSDPIKDAPPEIESLTVTTDPQPSPAAIKPIEKQPEPILANTPPVQIAPPVDAFKERLAAQEALAAKDPANVEEQFKLRMLYLLDGQEDKALAPVNGADAETQEIVIAQVRSLITAKGASQRDPAAWANKQLEAVENLRTLVRSRADLRVPSVVICNAIEGFGRYTPIEPLEFKAGQQNMVLVYIEVDNFSTAKTATGMHRTLLSVRQSLLNKVGEELWSAKDENIEDLARQQRRDFYLTIGPLAIPKSLGPGEYVLKVEVEDMLAGKINGKSATFKMIAEEAPAPQR